MTQFRKGDRDLIKKINVNLVLNHIKSRGPVSRTEIARLSGLSLATISGITAELVKRDLIHEMGEGESTGGRRPVLLRLNHRAGYVIGVKLMEDTVTTALTDLDANVLHHRVTHLSSEPASGGEWDVHTVVQKIVDAITNTIATSEVDRDRLLGIGIGLAGIVDGGAGICRYSPFFGWHDAPLAELIGEHFNLPIYLENNVNTLTIAEQWFGHGHDVEHFLVVTVGRGVGAGIVVNGQFYRGAIGAAGEFGHITLTSDGPRCPCGKYGCLEALASDPAIIRQAHAAIALGEQTALADQGPLTLNAIVDAAERGDQLAQRLLADSGRWLGIGISTLVNLFNPELIIVAGEGAQAGEWRFAPMREALHEHVFNGLIDHVEIIVESLGDKSWARGAACVVLSDVFKSPVHKQQAPELAPVSP